MATEHDLKYGENPQQDATIVFDRRSSDRLSVANFTPVLGGAMPDYVHELGWVNLTDLDRGVDALVRIAAAFEANLKTVPQIAILIEHGNVAGGASGTSGQVLVRAIKSNYRAAFGSFLVTNIPITRTAALAMREVMVARRPFAGIAAPQIETEAVAFFKRKKGKCHMLVNPALGGVGADLLPSTQAVRTIRGALVKQTPNTYIPKFPKAWDEALVADMCLAWGVCASSDSNSITVARNQMIIANAVGQQERAVACELAVAQARRAQRLPMLKGAAVASDSYFAFADGIDVLARKKVAAIFATHGSVRDKEVAEHAGKFDVIFHTVQDVKGRGFAGH